LSLISAEDFGNQCPPPKVSTIPQIEDLFFMHSQIYVAGRYCKLKRHISNSPWYVGGKKLTEDSVEELITQFLTSTFRNSGMIYSDIRS
jgi:tRNA pseudouridine synthase 10